MAEDFKINRATINFIYSFLPVTNEMSLSKTTLDRICDLYMDKKDYTCGEGKPDNRTGISSYLALNLEMGFALFPKFSGKSEQAVGRVPVGQKFYPKTCITRWIEAFCKKQAHRCTVQRLEGRGNVG